MTGGKVRIRPASAGDEAAIWGIIGPIFGAGETYAIESDISREEALAYWRANACFVAELDGKLFGTYYLKPNQRGGGAHVCNCGFATSQAAQGKGIARAMLDHSLEQAKEAGFRAMQFNFVLANNMRAIETWKRAGFVEIGRIPQAFDHPKDGMVDALILHRFLA